MTAERRPLGHPSVQHTAAPNASRRRALGRTAGSLVPLLATALPLSLPQRSLAQDPAVPLGAPQTERNALLQLLARRQSSRSFRPDPLSDAVLANLVWAAAGINRPDSGRRTAPTANNRQEVDLYVATSRGLFLYEPKTNALRLVQAGDLRDLTGRQGFVRDAAVNLVYVADYARSSGATDEDKLLYAAAATGFMSQNVYLYCASEGLATVVRAYVDRAALGEAMKLRPTQRITLAQSVGFPKA